MANFFSKIFQKFQQPKIDWEELEADLVTSDLGIKLALKIVEDLQEKKDVSAEDIIQQTKAEIARILPEDAPTLEPLPEGQTQVLFIVGVNGTGKTTSSAKLAYYLKNKGYSVLLAAADTFRAAAVEQLEHWADKLEVPLYKGRPNQDPASVCFEAHTQALATKTQFLICDTAGRLHTRHNLMEELSKIRRTLAKQDEKAPHKSYLVVDATTGANALSQARQFHKICPLDGIIMTKLDGSGKGGIAVALMDELQLAPHFVGLGEGASDFKPFQKEEYIHQLL